MDDRWKAKSVMGQIVVPYSHAWACAGTTYYEIIGTHRKLMLRHVQAPHRIETITWPWLREQLVTGHLRLAKSL